MKRSQITAIALAVAALSAGHAMAAEPLSRAQVQAELADAIRTGELIAGATGQKLNEASPHLFAAKAVVAGKSRAQVNAELAAAIRSGDIVDGATGQTVNQNRTGQFAAPVAVSDKTREQAKAELRDALRKGDVMAGGTGGRYNQLYPTSFSRSN